MLSKQLKKTVHKLTNIHSLIQSQMFPIIRSEFQLPIGFNSDKIDHHRNIKQANAYSNQHRYMNISQQEHLLQGQSTNKKNIRIRKQQLLSSHSSQNSHNFYIKRKNNRITQFSQRQSQEKSSTKMDPKQRQQKSQLKLRSIQTIQQINAFDELNSVQDSKTLIFLKKPTKCVQNLRNRFLANHKTIPRRQKHKTINRLENSACLELLVGRQRLFKKKLSSLINIYNNQQLSLRIKSDRHQSCETTSQKNINQNIMVSGMSLNKHFIPNREISISAQRNNG